MDRTSAESHIDSFAEWLDRWPDFKRAWRRGEQPELPLEMGPECAWFLPVQLMGDRYVWVASGGLSASCRRKT